MLYAQSKYSREKKRLQIHLTLLGALLVSLAPFPSTYQVYSPDWLALGLLYWFWRNQSILGYWHIFFYGIAFDLLHFNYVGSESIGLILMFWIFLRYSTFFHFLPKIGQILAVFILLAMKQFCIQWILGITGEAPTLANYFIPPVLSVVLWVLIDRFFLDRYIVYKQN